MSADPFVFVHLPIRKEMLAAVDAEVERTSRFGLSVPRVEWIRVAIAQRLARDEKKARRGKITR